jgi:hypothetical protein
MRKGKEKRGSYLLSSLYHWNSAEGTAEASHCNVPFCPTGTPVPLASEIYGGSAERCSKCLKLHFKMRKASSFTDFVSYSLPYFCLLVVSAMQIMPENENIFNAILRKTSSA